jgi:hypothetical protein
MAWSENASAARQRHMGSPGAMTSAEDLQRRLEAFGAELRQLKEQEPMGASREWLDEAERRHQQLKNAIEDYRRERAEQEAESAWEAAKRNVQTSYQNLEEYTKTGAHKFVEGFRKSWDGVTNAFHRAFGRDREQEPS